MKRNILIASDLSTNVEPLLKAIFQLLKLEDEKLVSLLLLDETYQRKFAVAGNDIVQPKQDILLKIELEMRLEERLSHFPNTAWINDKFKQHSIRSKSNIADLLVVQPHAMVRDFGWEALEELLIRVQCPILLIPDAFTIDQQILIHSGNEDTINGIRQFVQLFNDGLRETPLSVYVSDPDNGIQIENEKAIISYLKLYFKNIGIQLIHGQADEYIRKMYQTDSANSFTLMSYDASKILLRELLTSEHFSPTFIFKKGR